MNLSRIANPALVIVVALVTASCANRNFRDGSDVTAGTISADPERTVARPVPMDPRRTIAEQDCTKPIELDRGNLRCR